MINFNSNKRRKLFAAIIVVVVALAMVIPTVLSALNGFF